MPYSELNEEENHDAHIQICSHPERRVHLRWLLFFTLLLIEGLRTWPAGGITAFAGEDKGPKAESRFTTLDGARVHYVNYGKGDEALVLIHGWIKPSLTPNKNTNESDSPSSRDVAVTIAA